MKNLFFLSYFLFLATSGFCQATIPPLERTISVNAHDVQVEKLLDIISQKGKFSFSYSPKSFDTKRKITIAQQKKTVRFILNSIFNGTVLYKTRDNFIILSSAGKKQIQSPQELKYVWVNGYTINRNDSSKITGASVFEEKSLRSVITDQYGYFSIQLPVNASNAQLNIKKEGFRDTALLVEKGKFQSVEIPLSQITFKSKTIIDSIVSSPAPVSTDTTKTIETEASKKNPPFGFLLNTHMKTNLRNVTDTFFKKAQFSIVPGLSTNRKCGTRVVNNFSFNLLAGYSQGVKGFELGGLANINQGTMYGFQLGGLLNTAGGDVKGLQIGGLVNLVKGNMTGLQIGGLVNVVGKKTYGAQIGGLVNYNNDTTTGALIGGLFNVTRKQSNGFSLGGLSNYSKSHNGSQLAGLYNHTHTINGSQMAGLFNFAKYVKGSQISGLFNYAHNIKGFQLGVFNYADSCSGAAIGVLSIVKTGYHKIEISGDEIVQVNLGFRSGTEIFHTNFGAGLNPAQVNEILWTYSYGIGSSFKLVKTLWMDIDLTASHLNKGNHADYLNLNNKVYVGLDWRFAKKVSIAAGPTLNLFLTDIRNTGYAETFDNIRPSYLSNKRVDTNLDLKTWIGVKLAVRFL